MPDYNIKEPVFFVKPETTLLRDNEPFYVPDEMGRIDYECELVIRINKMVKSVSERFASKCYAEIGLGIDFTARDLQKSCVKNGYPWDISKCFDYSSALSSVFMDKSELPEMNNLHFRLEKNGQVVQQGFSGEMLFSFEKIIETISRYITLKTGDLVYTGTPAGIGPVLPGDRLTGYLEQRQMFDFMIK